MKTVLSFSPEYLQETGVVPKGFVAQNKGDYRGHIDQMRLRMAIMHGLERMGHRFDDLRYVGVIQVDTLHVHCHLAMVDAGLGRRVRTEKGMQQKGKLTSADISLLRRGVDSWLDENQHVAHMSSAVGYERMNVAAFVKRWAHEKVLDESLPSCCWRVCLLTRRCGVTGLIDRRCDVRTVLRQSSSLSCSIALVPPWDQL